MDYITTIQLESERTFQSRLETANDELREELLELKEGMQKRKEFMDENKNKILFFENNSQKLAKIKEWYPRAYKNLVGLLPNFILMPDDMPSAVLNLANEFVLHLVLPSDKKLLAFS